MGPPAGSWLKPKDGGRSRSLSSGTAALRLHSESPRLAVHPHPSTDLSSPCTHSARLYPQPALVRPDHGGGGQSVCTGRGGRGWSTPQTTPPTRTSPGRPCTDPNTTPHCASDTVTPLGIPNTQCLVRAPWLSGPRGQRSGRPCGHVRVVSVQGTRRARLLPAPPDARRGSRRL